MAITTPTRKVSLARNKPYISRAKLLLQNYFIRISCAAIGAVLHNNDYKFTASFYYLHDVESQHDGIEDGSGKFARIPPTIKVFIKHNWPKKTVELRADLDYVLVKEATAIPQLNTEANKPTIIRPDIEIIDLIDDDDSSTEGSTISIHEGNRDSSIVQDNEEPQVEDCLCCYMEYPQAEMKECTTEPVNALQPAHIRPVADQPAVHGNAPPAPPQQNDLAGLGAALGGGGNGGGGNEVEDARALLDACRIT